MFAITKITMTSFEVAQMPNYDHVLGFKVNQLHSQSQQ